MFAFQIVLTKRNKLNEFRVTQDWSRFVGKISIHFSFDVVLGVAVAVT